MCLCNRVEWLFQVWQIVTSIVRESELCCPFVSFFYCFIRVMFSSKLLTFEHCFRIIISRHTRLICKMQFFKNQIKIVCVRLCLIMHRRLTLGSFASIRTCLFSQSQLRFLFLSYFYFCLFLNT